MSRVYEWVTSWWKGKGPEWEDEEMHQDALDKMENEMQDGDLILFSGKNYWFSYVVEWGTWSEYSHVGIFLRDPTGIKPHLNGVYLFESGVERFPDAVDHELKWGVQIADLKTVVDTYIGQVYIRRLRMPEDRRKELRKLIPEIYQSVADAPYDTSVADFLRAEMGWRWGDWGDNRKTDRFFCSALVSYIYAKVGLLPKDIEWDLVEPRDYSDGKVDAVIQGDAKFDEIVRIK